MSLSSSPCPAQQLNNSFQRGIVRIQVPSLLTCVNWMTFLNDCELDFPHLENGKNNDAYLQGLCED
jgi:hypothetical protein